jgi:predicted MFS family arabinose efflux permease
MTSTFAILGGLLILLFVPDGPYRKKSSGFDLMAFFKVFQNKRFRSAAFGYFGHMWELYTFWAFVPVILQFHNQQGTNLNIPLWSFIIIAAGGLGCILGGYRALNKGSASVAFLALLSSGVCCLLSPILLQTNSLVLLLFLLFWGFMVVTDSPQFSTLVAQTATKELIGTALTIVNCIGFAITIFSIQLLSYAQHFIPFHFLFLLLLPGPIFGLWSMCSEVRLKQD